MKTHMLSVRIPDSLFQRIKEIADVERRSIANVALLLLEQALPNYVQPSAKTTKPAKIRIVK